MYNRNKKILAIFLIAVFAQKLSIGLYLHNWLHKNKNHFISDHRCPAIDPLQVKCTCIADVLMPLIASENIDELSTEKIYSSTPASHYCSFIIPVAKTFNALRGPPHCGI
jgi:hypothetical protein